MDISLVSLYLGEELSTRSECWEAYLKKQVYEDLCGYEKI